MCSPGQLRFLLPVIITVSLSAQRTPVPTVWEDAALADWPAPVASLNVRPGLFNQGEYYAVAGDNFRTYPVYHPDREPAGYWQQLNRLKPEKLVDSGKLRTKGEWIAAGKRAWNELDTPSFRSSDPDLIARARSRAILSKVPLQPDGTVFALRWVVTDKGLQIGYLECASCHTRFMPDGSRLPGAPENGAIEDTGGIGTEMFNRELLEYFKPDSLALATYKTFAVPWGRPDIHDRIKSMSGEELDALFGTTIRGTFARINGSPYFITKIPDLIGIKDRKYIDHTATHRHRGLEDLMRYAALVQGSDCLEFGSHRFFTNEQRRILFRYDDAVLYALAQYVYSLQPPPNPNQWSESARRGKQVFEREGCPGCHTPPLYTNNKLTVAKGYTPTPDHPFRQDILPITVETDPGLALRTRKGTGLYKVPSLRGVWYRGLYLHDGSVASLEEMFDPHRLSPDHVPGGWKGPGVKVRGIPGHVFGLGLEPKDKDALIAFLRTLQTRKNSVYLRVQLTLLNVMFRPWLEQYRLAWILAQNNRSAKRMPPAILLFAFVLLAPWLLAQDISRTISGPAIPRAWDDSAVAELEVPLAGFSQPVRHVSADYYYRIPVRPVYKTYPVYHPAREPAGYWSWLQQQEPQVVFETGKLRTTEDWIRAGELVFKGAGDVAGDLKNVRDPKWYAKLGIQLAADGSDPSARYIVIRRGQIEVRYTNCSSCHTRVLSDGRVITGAQGNPPVGRFDAANLRQQFSGAASKATSLKDAITNYRRMFAVPWLDPDPAQQLEGLSTFELLTALEAIPPGVVHRSRTSILFPPKTPDLIGVKDRRYLDATGLVQHRSIADLMRYAASVDGEEDLAAFGNFRLVGKLPDPATRKRFSDEQLYALATYVYSLPAPLNPNRPSALTARGEQVFRREGCGVCHPPPLYTNNKLTPADGFVIPDEHKVRYDILPVVVGTDSRLALQTRKGTGYYRVPSLKGVWYRGPFEHNGSVATLEDWFDPARLHADYVPTGFKRSGGKTGGVPGHVFGLKLNREDKSALIEFLKTL